MIYTRFVAVEFCNTVVKINNSIESQSFGSSLHQKLARNSSFIPLCLEMQHKPHSDPTVALKQMGC